MKHVIIALASALSLGLAGCDGGSTPAADTDATPAAVETVTGESTLSTVTEDGVTIHGDVYFGDLDATAPLILLFHQGAPTAGGSTDRWSPG